MRRSTLWMCALLTIGTSGCKQVSEQYAKIKQTILAKIAQRRGRPVPAAPQPVAQAPRPSADTAVAFNPLSPTTSPPAPPSGRRHVPQAPEVARPARDVPYDSPDTGTIAPGMAEKDIYSLWGPPIAVRHQGDMTFLYFRNGCEYTCGTEDVVFLQNGQVVDAVLRWPGHGYSGQSSSPAATPPHGPARPGGDTLTVKSPSTRGGP
ncbi:MAG TPA: hypothetical protein VFD76_09965 [Gemmatimonadales bacterium]|jgi:hypothetical protein|nr:hypothetical protein [Gemmatimonadales bacterium]